MHNAKPTPPHTHCNVLNNFFIYRGSVSERTANRIAIVLDTRVGTAEEGTAHVLALDTWVGTADHTDLG